MFQDVFENVTGAADFVYTCHDKRIYLFNVDSKNIIKHPGLKVIEFIIAERCKSYLKSIKARLISYSSTEYNSKQSFHYTSNQLFG